MPSRWWIPLSRLDPEQVKPEYVHGAASAWFDTAAGTHAANQKPYALSPLGSGPDGRYGFEVGVLTAAAEQQVQAATGTQVRLGRQNAEVGPPELITGESWESLDRPSGARRWELEFLTPATFRQGNRSSPFPAPASVLRGLRDSWVAFAEATPRALTPEQTSAVWVAEIDGSSQAVTLAKVTYVGFLGRVEYRCDDPAVADVIDGWFRLAAYAGVGSAKIKGLGVTSVSLPGREPRPPQG